mgnify:FL=1
MTSKIKVDNINKVSDDSNIIKKCGTTVTVGAASDGVRTGANNLQASDGGNLISQSGTTITLGASGDTITLASGANQSGFGRSGSVNWQTGSLKTSTFTAADGEGYFINSGSAITMNLPAGSAGAIVAVSDYARNFSTYNLTIAANGSEKIGGDANDATLGVDGQAATFVYVDATKGWVNVQNAEDTETGVPPAYIAASASGCTGPGSGCIVCTNYKIHTFNGPGTFTVTAGAGPIGIADYLVLAGGGGGTWDRGEGGGAGGYRESSGAPSGGYTASPLGACVAAIPLTVGAYPITVGGGGIAGTNPSTYYGGRGNNSILSTIISTGGGGGGGTPNSGPGGSGGGAHGGGTNFGTGNTPPVSPSQGFPGGPGLNGNPANSGGGGGATAAGTGNNPGGGDGGAGATSNITNSPVVRGGGGGGSRAWCGNGNGGSGSGGPGGGGGAGGPGGSGTNGTANLGGGGGGAGNNPIPTGINGGTGGSGVVIVRYRFQ